MMHTSRVTRAVCLSLFVLVLFLTAGTTAIGADVWINEIKYDGPGPDIDSNPGVEVAGTAGLDLSGWSLHFYNGLDGTDYGQVLLSGTISDEGGCLGISSHFFFDAQNGPDAIALVDDLNAVVDFISYEGFPFVTAVDGPAAGMAPVDIGVSENSSENSIQLTGEGTTSGDFIWLTEQPRTPGSINTDQTFLNACAFDPDNIFVNFTAGPNGDGTFTSPFNSLAEAIAAANASATINMEPGTSTETFTGGDAITKVLTLRNDTPPNGSVIVGGVSARGVGSDQQGGFVSRPRKD